MERTPFTESFENPGGQVKYLSPVGSMIKLWVTTFWFMKVALIMMFYVPQEPKSGAPKFCH